LGRTLDRGHPTASVRLLSQSADVITSAAGVEVGSTAAACGGSEVSGSGGG